MNRWQLQYSSDKSLKIADFLFFVSASKYKLLTHQALSPAPRAGGKKYMHKPMQFASVSCLNEQFTGISKEKDANLSRM